MTRTAKQRRDTEVKGDSPLGTLALSAVRGRHWSPNRGAIPGGGGSRSRAARRSPRGLARTRTGAPGDGPPLLRLPEPAGRRHRRAARRRYLDTQRRPTCTTSRGPPWGGTAHTLHRTRAGWRSDRQGRWPGRAERTRSRRPSCSPSAPGPPANGSGRSSRRAPPRSSASEEGPTSPVRTASSWTPASARPRPAYRNAGDFETQARALGGWREGTAPADRRGGSGHRGRRDELRDDVRGWDPRRGAAPFRPTRGALLRRHPTPATADPDRYDDVHRAIALSFTEGAGTTDVKVCDRLSGAIRVGREPAGLTWRGAARPRERVAAPRRRASPSHGADRRGTSRLGYWQEHGRERLRPRARRGRSGPRSHREGPRGCWCDFRCRGPRRDPGRAQAPRERNRR